MPRYAARKDANQKEIVSRLRTIGATVVVLDEMDLPDLLVGFRGDTYLFEVKDGTKFPSRRLLLPGQRRFFDIWRGKPPVKIESWEDAYRALGITVLE